MSGDPLLVKHLRWYVAQGREAKSIERRRTIPQALANHLGVPLAEVDIAGVESFLARRVMSDFQRTTEVSHIRSFYRWVAEAGYVAEGGPSILTALSGRGGRSIDPLLEEYVTERLTREELGVSSADMIEAVLRQWLRHVDRRSPNEWSSEEVVSWIDQRDRGGRPLAPATRKSRLTKLRPFVQWLVKKGEIERDITQGLRVRLAKSTNPRDLDGSEVERLLVACPDARAILIVILMVQMGLRCGDVARIRVEDVDLRRRTLHVRAKGGSGEPTHWIPIPDEAWHLLDPWVRHLGRPDGPVVESQHFAGGGISPQHISKLVGRWVRAAGLKSFPHDGLSAHALRHTCAQQMLDGGADLRDVQFALGHATIRSTEIYARREPPGLREKMNGRTYLTGAAVSSTGSRS